MAWTLREISEHLISSVNSWNNTVGSNINPLQVESMIPSLRQEAISIKYNGSRSLGAAKRINGDWVQKFTIMVDPTIQDTDADYLLVECPRPISINKNTSGIIYVGRKKRIGKFYMAQTRDEIATLQQRGFINNGADIVCIYAENGLEIYGNNSLEEVYFEMICQFPSDAPNFDEEFDPYPVSADLLGVMVDLFKQKMSVALAQPADTIPDMTPTNSIRQEKSNLQ